MATVTQPSDDLFRQAISAWQSAVESGVKMQEESARWLREMCCTSEPLTDWCSKGQAMAGETISKVQENIDEAIRVINQQVESSMKLLQKALDARQADVGADAGTRFVEWWEAATESMRTNSQTMLKANSRILSTWSELARKMNVDAADAMAGLARQTAEQAEKMTKSAAEHVKEAAGQAS